nr:uncharacterized protein LOC113829315 [Penaeus vannamei]
MAHEIHQNMIPRDEYMLPHTVLMDTSHRGVVDRDLSPSANGLMAITSLSQKRPSSASDIRDTKKHRTKSLHFTCTVVSCGEKFSTSEQLDTHMKLHVGVKPFTCEVCGKVCQTESKLKAHQASHATDGIKPVCVKYVKETFQVSTSSVTFDVSNFEAATGSNECKDLYKGNYSIPVETNTVQASSMSITLLKLKKTIICQIKMIIPLWPKKHSQILMQLFENLSDRICLYFYQKLQTPSLLQDDVTIMDYYQIHMYSPVKTHNSIKENSPHATVSLPLCYFTTVPFFPLLHIRFASVHFTALPLRPFGTAAPPPPPPPPPEPQANAKSAMTPSSESTAGQQEEGLWRRGGGGLTPAGTAVARLYRRVTYMTDFVNTQYWELKNDHFIVYDNQKKFLSQKYDQYIIQGSVPAVPIQCKHAPTIYHGQTPPGFREELGYIPPPNRKLPPVPGSQYNTCDRIKRGGGSGRGTHATWDQDDPCTRNSPSIPPRTTYPLGGPPQPLGSQDTLRSGGDDEICPYATFHLLGFREEMDPQQAGNNFQTFPHQNGHGSQQHFVNSPASRSMPRHGSGNYYSCVSGDYTCGHTPNEGHQVGFGYSLLLVAP